MENFPESFLVNSIQNGGRSSQLLLVFRDDIKWSIVGLGVTSRYCTPLKSIDTWNGTISQRTGFSPWFLRFQPLVFGGFSEKTVGHFKQTDQLALLSRWCVSNYFLEGSILVGWNLMPRYMVILREIWSAYRFVKYHSSHTYINLIWFIYIHFCIYVSYLYLSFGVQKMVMIKGAERKMQRHGRPKGTLVSFTLPETIWN